MRESPNGDKKNSETGKSPSSEYQELAIAIHSISHEQNAESEQERIQHRENIKWAKRTFWMIALYCFLTFIIAGAGVWAAWQAHNSVVVAINQLRIMADQEELQLQAYTGIDGFITLKCDTCDTASSWPPALALSHLFDDSISFRIKNFGQTPASQIRIDRDLLSVPFGDSLPRGFSYPISRSKDFTITGISQSISEPTGSLNPQGTASVTIALSPSDISSFENARSHKNTLFFYGAIRYLTIFDRECRYMFCYQYVPDNPQGNQFGVCQEHNTPECNPETHAHDTRSYLHRPLLTQ